uniref:Uncharacterized protein n=1 Tax=Setaria italica TaxID=4555 RepID=K3ZG06_SETIT
MTLMETAAVDCVAKNLRLYLHQAIYPSQLARHQQCPACLGDLRGE